MIHSGYRWVWRASVPLADAAEAVWFFMGQRKIIYHSKRGQPQGFAHALLANGFMAQIFRSPMLHPLLILAGLVLPFSRKVARKIIKQGDSRR
ncbi:hypothetical protein [Candidatus Villigracilis saccharophilus]|uniref:hypothetical protein n=1 Tax=Candidatus Villigracilis saccharophilus TaxID=3140684 RepID=UPI003136C6A2|nr:hypothetical protein [Anaerolineales bacterium]